MSKTTLYLSLIAILISNCLFAQPQLWGTTNNGGSTLSGTIFTLDTAGNNYNLEYDWQNLTDGKRPHSGLIFGTNEKFYGVTFQDGANFGGVLFEYDYVTGIYTKQHDFIDATGSFPEDEVIQASNGKLYGMTGIGGASNFGVLYEYDLSTNTYTNLVDFNGTTQGGGLHGKVVEAPNGKLYGMTSHGGTLGFGTLFEYDIPTATLTTKINLDSINSGYHPNGSLMLASNGKLYGMSSFGGITNQGLMFEYNYTTNVLTKLLDFTSVNGSYPQADLYEANNGKLYGLTFEGGLNNKGILFEYNIASSTQTTLIDFDGGIIGANPKGTVMQSSNGKLYGFTNFGGANNKGTVFEYDILTGILTTKIAFNGVNGVYNSKNDFIEICSKPTITITAVSNDTICLGESLTLTATGTGPSYSWDNGISNGGSITPSVGTTTYTVTSTNICGTSSHSIDVFVKPNITISQYDTVCSGESFTYPNGLVLDNVTSDQIYNSVFTASNSCDSTIVTYLHVNDIYTIYDTVSLCEQSNYTFPDNFILNNIVGNVTHISNLTASTSCDSIIYTTLEISLAYFIKDSVYVCYGSDYTYPDGVLETNVIAEVIHTSNLTSTYGCDSTIITTLNAHPTYNNSETVQVCEGDTYVFADGTILSNVTSAVTHTSNLLTTDGCDSIVVTTLSVSPIFTKTDNINLCYGNDYVFPDGTVYFNIINDTSQVSLVDAILSCDTIVTTYITINTYYSETQYDTICSGSDFTFPDGQVMTDITSNLNYSSNLFSIYGCDSTITTNIFISYVDTSILTIGFTQLVSNDAVASHQWLDCNTGIIVFGATNQNLIPPHSGQFAVIVSNDYCVDTSSCYTVETIGLAEQSPLLNVKIAPNPTNGIVNIIFDAIIYDTKLTIHNMNGQIIKSEVLNESSKFSFNLEQFENGIYFISIENKSTISYFKVIKK